MIHPSRGIDLGMCERRGDRAVEGARLEIVCTPNKGTGGSNPPLSATGRAQNPVVGPRYLLKRWDVDC
jgi:hypothetical protein